jgi:hypothetical protein
MNKLKELVAQKFSDNQSNKKLVISKLNFLKNYGYKILRTNKEIKNKLLIHSEGYPYVVVNE